MKYAAILFDMDGTLIHSIPLWERAVERSLRQHALSLSPDETKAILTGHTLRDVLLVQGIDQYRISAIYSDIDQELLPMLKSELGSMDGAVEFLKHLKSLGIKTGIVTSSHIGAVDAVHEAIGIRDLVDTIVTFDDVVNVKPHPEPILLAASHLGVDPKACLYIGDQAVDRDAAAAVGMDFILYRSASTPEKTKHSDEVSSFEELKVLIGL